MKKILVVTTNVAKYESTTRATGVWFGEVVHFVDPFIKKGYSIDYASPKGGISPIDPHSISADMMTALDWEYYNNHEFMNKLGNTLSLADVDYKNYDVIYFAGGHGVIWDFLNDKNIQEISKNIYENDGIVSAVCHGVIALLNIKLSSGEFLIKDKKVTGFSNSEEKEVQLDSLVPYLTEDELKNRGAIYMQKENWQPFAIENNRVVSGQNPASGLAVATEVLNILEK